MQPLIFAIENIFSCPVFERLYHDNTATMLFSFTKRFHSTSFPHDAYFKPPSSVYKLLPNCLTFALNTFSVPLTGKLKYALQVR